MASLPFSQRRLCRDPSLPLRRASRRSRESRRRSFRVVVVTGLLSRGTDSLTDWPLTRVGDAGAIDSTLEFGSGTESMTISDAVVACVTGTMRECVVSEAMIEVAVAKVIRAEGTR